VVQLNLCSIIDYDDCLDVGEPINEMAFGQGLVIIFFLNHHNQVLSTIAAPLNVFS
jgi:hypothetical protein